MPGKTKCKKWIGKTGSTSFHLASRDQKDPLTNDVDAPQHVLMPVTKRKEDQIKYGIYFEDDYNYLQHLRDVNELNDVGLVDSFRIECSEGKEKPSLVLPSSVFGSTTEMKVGLLNKAVKRVGPQVDVDPDIAAAMDDDFDFEDPDNELEDNFIELVNENGVLEEEDEEGSDYSNEFDEDSDENNFGEEETKSRFTNYSMSSAVTKRSEGLTKLDEQFETLIEQYDESMIGGLDDDEDMLDTMEPNPDAPEIVYNKRMMKNFEDDDKLIPLKDFIQKGDPVSKEYHYETNFDDQLETMVMDKPVVRFNCESVLSTRSSLYNHPKPIDNIPSKKHNRIRLTKRAEIPADVLPTRGPTRRQMEAVMIVEDEDEIQQKLHHIRMKDETPEERRIRKQMVKEERRERRVEKAENKKTIKNENLIMEKRDLHNQTNLQCVRII